MTKTKAKPAENLLDSFLTAARSKYENDIDLETKKGVDIEVEGVGTFTVLRAHARNENFIKAYRERVTPFEGEKAENASRDVFVDTVIVGMKTPTGQKIPYDDKAKTAIKNLLKVTPDLYTLLMAESVRPENFRKQIEAERKN